VKDRHRNETHAAPERALHHQEYADQQKIGEIVTRNSLTQVAGQLPEFGQFLPDKGDRSQYLEREQQEIDAGFSLRVVRIHPADDIRSTGGSVRLVCVRG
jgi:hypothetical protein